MEALATDAIALNNLAYLYEHGEFVNQDIRKAKELYNKAYVLGNVDVVDNWMRFSIKYPDDIHIFRSNLKKAHELGSKVPSEFVSEYATNEVSDEVLLVSIGELNDAELWDVLLNRLYEEEVNDGLMDIFGEKFIVNAQVEAKAQETMLGTYEYVVDLGEEYGIFELCNKSIALYGANINSN